MILLLMPNEQLSNDSRTEDYINFIVDNTVPKNMTEHEIQAATNADPVLQKVISHVQNNDWYKSERDILINPFYNVRDELSVTNNNILLRGNRIVIPDELIDRTINIAHEGHQGIVKCKMLLREKVWFPNLDKRVHHIVSTCIPCAATVLTPNHQPLRMSPLPETVFKQISCDFCGPLPTGEMLMVVIDDYSRYPAIEIINSTSSNTVISALDRVLSMFPIPEVVKTDNGPPFNSDVFKQYAAYLGFKHRKVTPLHPQANGEVERFMKTLMKAIQAAKIEGKYWKQELQKFLRAYRSTKHCTTGKSPNEILFNRSNLRSRLPEIKISHSENDAEIRQKDQVRKQQMKSYADDRRNSKEHHLQVGDTVLVRQQKKNKLSSVYNPEPITVTDINHSMITATRNDNSTITRNASFFKKIGDNATQGGIEEEDDDIIPSKESEDPPAVTREEEQTDTEKPEKRYPQRNRRLPSKLKDYIMNARARFA